MKSLQEDSKYITKVNTDAHVKCFLKKFSNVKKQSFEQGSTIKNCLRQQKDLVRRNFNFLSFFFSLFLFQLNWKN